MAIASHNFHGDYGYLPSIGEADSTGGVGLTPFRDFTNSVGTPYEYSHSFFTYLLPYIEADNVYKQMDLSYAWNDNRRPGNQVAARAKISVYLCPSNGFGDDPDGFGRTDYMPIVKTDIDPITGIRNKVPPCPQLGMLRALANGKITLGQVTVADGTSNTLLLIEDNPRTNEKQFPFTVSKYPDNIPSAYNGPGALPSGNHRFYAWADPDTANGISGPPNATVGNLKGVINNNSTPIGGPPDAPWTANNCGPNDEPFSLHPGGCNAVFGDGHVAFLPQTMDPRVMRRLVTWNEGVAVSESDWE